MSFESHTTTATMNAAETSSPDPSADDSVASNGIDAVPASGDATGLEAAFPFSPPTLTEEDIVELELFHPEDEDLEPPASMYGAIPGTVAAVILHVWLLATLHNYIRTEPDVLAARPVAVTIEEKEVEEEKPEKEKDPKLTLANPNDKDHEQKEALNATSVGASRSKEPQVYSAPEPPSPEINPELTRNEVYDIPEGLILDESQVVKGTTGNAPVQIEAALDRVTHEIAMNLRERKVLLVWLIDGSASLKTQREIVAKRMKRIYGELDALQEAGQIPKGKSPLLTGVVSFGLTTHFTTPNPTQNFEEIENAVKNVKIDESGRENVFSAVINVIKRWGKHQLSRRIMIVAVTDESGDDFGALRMAVSTCRRHGAKAYVIGPEAPFGRRKGYVPYVDEYGDSHQIPVDLGPETARYENVQLPFWFEGPQYTYLSSGYGPYGLSRLVSETGGIYFTTNTMTMKGLTPLGTYDSEKLRPFKPDYKYDTPLEYDTDLIKHPLRVAIVQAAKFSREHKPEGTPQLDLKVTPANFRQMATSAQQTVARSQLMVDTILQAFPKGIEKEIDNEQSPRWRMTFCLTYGRLLALRVRCLEYNSACAELKGGLSPQDVASNANHWIFRPSKNINYATSERRNARKAIALLQRVIDEAPGTPWAVMAARELQHPLGITVVKRFIPPPTPRARRPGPPRRRGVQLAADPRKKRPPRKPAPKRKPPVLPKY